MDILLNALKAAAEPTRLRILLLSAHGELSVSDLTQILGQSQPRVSRHLKLLADAGLLQRFREGTFAYFRLAEHGPGADLVRMLADLVPTDDPVLSLDLERLEAIKQVRAQEAEDYFARNAPRWDEIRTLHIDDSKVEETLLAMLPDGPIDNLLDVGTGTGRILEIMAPRAKRAIGLDLSREMLSIARTKLERLDLRHCQVRQASIYQLPFGADTFEAGVIHQVLHFLESPGDAIGEVARVIAPGGVLLVADFASHDHAQLRGEHAHRWLGFDETSIAGWMTEAGCQVDTVEHLVGKPLTVTIWGGRKIRAGGRHPEAT